MLVFGESVRSMSIEERIQKVGVVFQDPDDQLFMPTLYDDVAFGPINMGLSRDEVDQRVREALATVGLSGFEDRVPHHMSYGEKKRAALAAVLSMEPRVLVLDEPTANLDPKTRALLIDLINRLNREKGITTIVADGDVHSIFSDSKLLKENNLEAPDAYKLFRIMGCYGYTNCNALPLSVADAPGALDASLEENGGAIHLRRDGRTAEELREVFERFDY